MCYWGGVPGFPWFMCIVPVLFFLGVMFFISRFRYRWRSTCCHQETSNLAEEVARLRKELEESKKGSDK